MMEHLGQVKSCKFKYSKKYFSRSRNSNSRFRFWWNVLPGVTAATEEWTGAGSPLTKTITVS
jgi:hypothetical protein